VGVARALASAMEATATLLLGAWCAVGKNFYCCYPALCLKSRNIHFSVNRYVVVYLSNESLSVKLTLFKRPCCQRLAIGHGVSYTPLLYSKVGVCGKLSNRQVIQPF